MRDFTPRCRACGYDLGGEVACWKGECPLQGRCSECGAALEWQDVMGPAARVRWVFDLPRVRGVALGRWWGTFLCAFYPPRFWARLGGEPSSPPRVWLWLGLMVVQFHLLNLAVVLVSRAADVAGWSSPGDPFPFWQTTGVTIEMLFSPYYDQGEITASGSQEPMYFLDRPRIGLVAGSLVAGALLWGLRMIRPELVRRDALRRAVVYGMMPLAFMYMFWSGWSLVQLIGEHVLRAPMQWWYGRQTPTGREPGAGLWYARVANVASVLWMGAWWWHAAGAVIGESRVAVRLVVTAAAVGVAGLVLWQYLDYWGRWGVL